MFGFKGKVLVRILKSHNGSKEFRVGKGSMYR